jgi:benzaldehyde dehydrogenase (NAD)
MRCNCYEAAALPSRSQGELLPSQAPRLSMVRRVPAGVVSVITPFNAPLALAIRSVAPALALGNAVVLKPDRRTAVCGGVALVVDPHVRVISFTGSTAAGRAVGELAGRQAGPSGAGWEFRADRAG